MSDEKSRKLENPEDFEVVELDDEALEEVAGGSNGNCPCPAGSPVPTGSWDNGNCPAGGGGSFEQV